MYTTIFSLLTAKKHKGVYEINLVYPKKLVDDYNIALDAPVWIGEGSHSEFHAGPYSCWWHGVLTVDIKT